MNGGLRASGGKTCVCAAGLFKDANGDCQPCPDGTYSYDNATVCLSECGPGKYALAGTAQCVACPVGRYSNATGATDDSVCVHCPAGRYSRNITGEASAAACLACGVGQHTGFGAMECYDCPPGHYCPTIALEVCVIVEAHWGGCPTAKVTHVLSSCMCRRLYSVRRESTRRLPSRTRQPRVWTVPLARGLAPAL